MILSTGTAIAIAVALWFAQGWYLNTKLERVHSRFDQLFESFNGLREYLYEIDPQFDEERALREAFMTGTGGMFAGADDLELQTQKKKDGFRTLNSTFFDGGFRAPNQ